MALDQGFNAESINLSASLGRRIDDIQVERQAKNRTLSNDDIETLAVLEFAAQGILQKYHAAMRQMETRLETLDQDLKLRQSRNPIHHIESRMKSVPSIFEKLERYGQPTTLEAMERYIMDIAGLRVIVSYVQDAYTILRYLEKQEDLEVVTVKDYIENPKANGYRSLHFIVKIPVFFLEGRQNVPVEIQIRTIAMDFWASLEHDLKYKSVSDVEGLDVGDELKVCSEIIEDVERRMQVLANALEEERSAHPNEVKHARKMNLTNALEVPSDIAVSMAEADVASHKLPIVDDADQTIIA